MPITLSQYKQHAPGLVGTDEDTDLGTFLEQAEGLLAGGSGWARTDAGTLRLDAATYTLQVEEPSAIDPGKLYLPVGWIESVSEVVISETWDWSTPDLTLVEGTDFVVDPRQHALRLKPGGRLAEWPDGSTVRVTCSGGWTTYPEEVVACIAWMARHLWAQRTGEGVTSRSYDGQTVAKAERTALPKHVKAMARAAGLVVWGSRAS